MSDEARAVVRHGYDDVAESYLAARTVDGDDLRALDALIASLATGGRVLDAGCGAGVPVTHRIVDAGLTTVGLDCSIGQLRLARRLAPAVALLQGDLASLPFSDATFDAVVSFYAIIHVPRHDHSAVFAEVRRVLRPGGWSLLCLGQSDNPADHDPESWLGTPMYWSHFDAATSLELLRAADLDVVNHEIVPDPMDHGGHLFALVRRPHA
jgi:ubiquinone/menaquinone biosynthesis C-methylase UbiE